MGIQGVVVTIGRVILVHYTSQYLVDILEVVDKVKPFMTKGFFICNYRLIVVSLHYVTITHLPDLQVI
jgi:hypothetical protein